MTINLYHDDLPNDLEFGDIVAIDTEAMGLNILRDRLCLVQLTFGDGVVHLVKYNHDTKFNSPNLVKLLEDDKILKIFHFARFDVAIMMHYLNCKVNNIFCTKISSKLCRTYTDRHGLKELVREIVGVSLDKFQQTSNWGNDVLTDAQQKYAASDVIHLHNLYNHFKEELIKQNREEIAKKCFDFMETRCVMDISGFDIDIFHH